MEGRRRRQWCLRFACFVLFFFFERVVFGTSVGVSFFLELALFFFFFFFFFKIDLDFFQPRFGVSHVSHFEIVTRLDVFKKKYIYIKVSTDETVLFVGTGVKMGVVGCAKFDSCFEFFFLQKKNLIVR
jgi:hypothetical protein